MATMKKMTKPASTTIAVFVTCIEILCGGKDRKLERKWKRPVDVLVEGALLLIDRGGKSASDEKCNDAWVLDKVIQRCQSGNQIQSNKIHQQTKYKTEKHYEGVKRTFKPCVSSEM